MKQYLTFWTNQCICTSYNSWILIVIPSTTGVISVFTAVDVQPVSPSSSDSLHMSYTCQGIWTVVKIEWTWTRCAKRAKKDEFLLWIYQIWHNPMQNKLWMISDMRFTSKYTCNRILVLYPKLRLYVEGFASREFSHSHAYHIAHRSWPFSFTILWYERAASHQVWQSPMFPYISFNQM